MELSEDDRDLIKIASDFLIENYEKGRHHVACALRCDGRDYLSLHLDTKGFDVCSEPIALSNALLDKQTHFDSLVSVALDDSQIQKVIAPCGNCRQILYEYAPDLQVIVPNDGSHMKVTAKSLLPIPYI